MSSNLAKQCKSLRVWGLRFDVQGLGFGVYGFRGLGFGV